MAERELDDISLRLGSRTFPLPRYVKMKRSGPERLLVFFDSPREVVSVIGEDNVLLAIEEVKMACGERERSILGQGWLGADGVELEKQ